MKWTQPGYSESQLWAKLDYECRMRGSSILAYVPVVAGGPNGLSMHYVRNDMKLRLVHGSVIHAYFLFTNFVSLTQRW